MVLGALHVNTLSGGRVGGSRVFIMAMGNGVPLRAVEVRVVSGDLSEVGVSRASQGVREDEVQLPAREGSESFFLARCCLGQVPGRAPFSQRSEQATACTNRMQISN